jgi:hypothetical protein
MVTAILPSVTGGSPHFQNTHTNARSSHDTEGDRLERASISSTIASDLTVTPTRLRSRARGHTGDNEIVGETEITKTSSTPPRLAGLVGVFTGCGALIALGLFLPLPARFSKIDGISAGQAVMDSYYVVASVAVVISAWCFFGLKNLRGEESKGWSTAVGSWKSKSHKYQALSGNEAGENLSDPSVEIPYWRLLLDAVIAGGKSFNIGLGYLGGFVARLVFSLVNQKYG